MDGEFACPECGQVVQVRRLAPGRQVRCPFCDRLLEVPFLPRVEGNWKRTRFTRPKWVPWAWAGVAAAVMAVIGTAGVQLLVRGERVARARAVTRLIESSEAHEAAGRLDLALIDLDSALDAAPATGVPLPDSKALRRRREKLARRDVQAILQGLESQDGPQRPVGGWLNLVARAGADRDLSPLRQDVEARFLRTLRAWIDELAGRATADRDPSAALALCGEAADLAVHLPHPDREQAESRLASIVASLVERRGVVIEAAPAAYVRGTAAGYERAFGPMAAEGLRERGYLPPPKTARWGDLWARAPYTFVYQITERHEGSYLGTENRLARIEVRLSLRDWGREVWATAPNARTIVPLPNLSSYLSGRLALNQSRSDEAEKLLYENALEQIQERFRQGLKIVPTPPGSAGPV